MKEYRNVDLLKIMEDIASEQLSHCKDEFEMDAINMAEYASLDDCKGRSLVWMVRKTGTWLFWEDKVFERYSFAGIAWRYYEKMAKEISAYRILISGIVNGCIMGDICEIDYAQHVNQVKAQAA